MLLALCPSSTAIKLKSLTFDAANIGFTALIMDNLDSWSNSLQRRFASRPL